MVGCSTSDYRISSDVHGPTLTVVDSVSLDEPDSLPMGTSFFLAKGPDRDTYLNDIVRSRILRFDARGRLVTTIGKPGSGPGELKVPGVIHLIDDSILAVNDVAQRTTSLFDAKTGVFLRGVRFPIQDIGQTWTTLGDTIVFAAHLSPSTVAKWVWRSDLVLLSGRTPNRLMRAFEIYVRYGRSEVIATEHGYLVLLPTEPGIHLLDTAANPVGFVTLPVARRRGGGEDLIERERRRKRGRRDFQPLGSGVSAFHRLASGEVVVVYLDVDQLNDTPIFGNFRSYLTLLSADLSRACVDAQVPLATDVLPLPTFRGDTLYLLSRVVTPNDRVQTSVVGYRISTERCDWISTGGITSRSDLEAVGKP
jgi:hypothetical protein